MKYTLGFSAGPASNTTVTRLEIDFNGLVERVKDIKQGPKDGSYLTRCAFSNDTRGSDGAKTMHMVILDCDKRMVVDGDGVVEIVPGSFAIESLHAALVELNLTHIIVPSFSNLAEGEDYFKQRIWLPVVMKTKEELVAAVAWTLGQLKAKGLELVNVPENNTVAQAWYLPRYERREALEAFKVLHHDGGQPFPLKEAVEWLEANPQTFSGKAPDMSKVTPLESRTGVVAELLSQHNSAGELLRVLQEHGYDYGRQAGAVDGLPSFFLRSPLSESGGFGVHVFFSKAKGVWVAYTHHANDELSGGHAHDYLSIVTVLDYGGNIKAAIAALTVGDIPHEIASAVSRVAKKLGIPVSSLVAEIKFNQTKLMEILHGTALRQGNSKFYLMADDGELRVFCKADLSRGIEATFGSPYSTYLLRELVKKRGKESDVDLDEIPAAIRGYILTERQFDNIEIEVDPFVTRSGIMSIKDGCAKLVFTNTTLQEGEVDMRLVGDYLEHWPMLEEFLDLLVASRFAADRKNAFLWLQAESDWGKGFLMSLFHAHGLVVSMSVDELEKVFAGGPVGRTLADFKRALVTEFNEVKNVKREVKMLENSMVFSPKGLPTVKVPLYLKVFTSAESVDSLASEATGIEDQFARRFSMVTASGSLNNRTVFQASKASYRQSLVNYVGLGINRRVAQFVALGRVGSANKADKVLAGFHAKHGMSNKYATLNGNLKNLVQQFKDWMVEEYELAHTASFMNSRTVGATGNLILSSCRVQSRDGSRFLIARHVPKLISTWMEANFNPSERGKLTWKSEAIRKELPQPNTYRVNGHERIKGTYVGELPSEPEDSESFV